MGAGSGGLAGFSLDDLVRVWVQNESWAQILDLMEWVLCCLKSRCQCCMLRALSWMDE